MNRKQRRAAGVAPERGNAAALFAAATQSHQAGQLAEAEALYRRTLALAPRHADALHRLGVLAYQVGDATAAIALLDRALAIESGVAAYHVHRGLALAAVGRLDDAAGACRAAVALNPDSLEAQANLGLVLLQAGQFDAAAQAGRRTVALAPDLADGHNILGEALQALGQADEAIASLRRAVALAPDFAEAHNGLGQALWRLGRLDEAADHFQRAIMAAPGFTLAYSNLAGVQKAQGRLDLAAANLRHAAALAPQHPAVLNNLAVVLMAQGDAQQAMQVTLRALEAGETAALRETFVHCATTLQIDSGGERLRPLLIRALGEAWGRPEDLVRIALDLSKQAPALAETITAAAAHADRVEPATIEALGDDALLLAVLRQTPNIDIEVERALTLARRTLLQATEAGDPLSAPQVAFYASLAQQAFINEFVFAVGAEEAERAQRCRDSLSICLAAGDAAPIAVVLAAACYQPLASLAFAERLLSQTWPEPMRDLLTMQIAEPAEEAQLRNEIPRLTPIVESSLRVQAQYEDNPYPRWVQTAVASAPQSLSEHLLNAYPHAGLAPLPDGDIEVLIAGCGAGRNALETHRAFSGANTLAVDLSAASLAYALRKARQSGETRLQFAQADLLHIAGLGRHFDLIEASGVLHHMTDPFAGWRALLSVLRPGGVMRLGFYSALARRNLPDIEIGEPTPQALRQARQDLAMLDDQRACQALLAQDFYSLSGCRDLLFHTCEHRLALGDLAAFMNEAGLRFVGFVIEDQILNAYRQRFPNDVGARDLNAWRAFEQDHPDTFARMYQFWVQKG